MIFAPAALLTLAVVAAVPDGSPKYVDLSMDFEKAELLNTNEGARRVFRLAERTEDLRTIAVIKNGLLTVEYTRDDIDEGSLHFPIWSSTKSWISLVIGIMAEEGLISINETLGDIWPDEEVWTSVNNTDFTRNVTIESMLTMSSGLISPPFDLNSTFHDGGDAGGIDLQSALSYPWVGEEGKFSYLGSSNILSYAIQERTDLSPREYVEQKILPFLGMTGKDIEWDQSAGGMEFAYHGLNLTAMQMAKFGQLYLQGGLASPSEDDRVVSSEWVKKSGSPLVDTGFLSLHYGYLFWVLPGGSSYCAIGYGSQLICIDDAQELVFVQQMEYEGKGAEDSMDFDFFTLLMENPSILNEEGREDDYDASVTARDAPSSAVCLTSASALFLGVGVTTWLVGMM